MAIDASQDVWLPPKDESKLSAAAQQIRNCGELVCQASWIVSVMVIIMAAAGSAYIDESRPVTFVFFGIAPAAIIYMIGFLLHLLLMWVGAVYDIVFPYVEKGFGVVSKLAIVCFSSLYHLIVKLNLYENIILKPIFVVLGIAKMARPYCLIDAPKIDRFRRLGREAYRNFMYVSMFPVRQSAQLLIRLLGQTAYT
jgi:hypothetical protein